MKKGRENIIHITKQSESQKAMKNRCEQCKQLESFISDSVYFSDGDHTVDDLHDFRKHGFVEDQNGKKCPCYSGKDN